MSIPSPVLYSDDIETLRDDEGETIEQLCQTFDKILETTAEDYGKAVRSVHAKAHGILEGTLTILDELPEELAQGLFAAPAKHDVVLRISTNPGDILNDAISLPRGLAMKVMDVAGERLPDAVGTTQDFVLVNAPIFEMKNAERFLANLKLLAATTDKAEGAKVALSKVLRPLQAALDTVGLASPKIGGMGGVPNTDPLGETYYSATPFRYGDYVAKFGLFPVSQDLLSRKDETIDATMTRTPSGTRSAKKCEVFTVIGNFACNYVATWKSIRWRIRRRSGMKSCPLSSPLHV